MFLLIFSRKCDIFYGEGIRMSVSYKKLQHLLIERDISHSDLMRMANISANIISKLKNGQYIALDKVESICQALDCTPNDILVFIPDSDKELAK